MRSWVRAGQLRDLPEEMRRDVRRLALARFVTELGTRAAFVAIVLRAGHLTSTSTAVGLALALIVAADAVTTPLAGIAGDRWDRRRVMICSDVAAAALYLLLAGTEGFAPFVGVAVLAVVAESFYFPSAGAALSNLVSPPHLGVASATVSQARMAGTILGPVLAGVVATSTDVRWLFVVNALSFLLAARLVSALRGSFQTAPEAPAEDHRMPEQRSSRYWRGSRRCRPSCCSGSPSNWGPVCCGSACPTWRASSTTRPWAIRGC